MIKKVSTLPNVTDIRVEPLNANIYEYDLFQVSISGSPADGNFSSDGWASTRITYDNLVQNLSASLEDARTPYAISLSSDTNPVVGDSRVVIGNQIPHIFNIKTLGDAITLSGSSDGSSIILSATDKYAIVPSKDGDYVAMVCTEMPETRFEDVVTIPINGYDKVTHVIDDEFLFVCEENSIDVISCVSNKPAIVGCEIINNYIAVDLIPQDGFERPTKVTVKISGIRKGRLGKRFVKFTEEQANQNNAFWSEWTR